MNKNTHRHKNEQKYSQTANALTNIHRQQMYTKIFTDSKCNHKYSQTANVHKNTHRQHTVKSKIPLYPYT